jgi:hypothetical protein
LRFEKKKEKRSKENEQKRETTARGHLETKTSYEKQYKNNEPIVLLNFNGYLSNN